ncbi:MAG: efflux RND transporter periplasmic adaptor subunit [Caulobacteraceae bacterium]|nr:efflux RND transporter periplasmic adaptor subunit [Caulobacteraceae bacterium]
MAAGLAAAAALVLQGCSPHGQGGQNRGPAEVGVVTIEPQSVTLQTELPGRTTPYETSDVRPQVGGIIKARLFTEGSNVKAGQVLYQIDPAPYRAAYDQAAAQLASAEANLVTTKVKAERYADLVKINGVSRQDSDDAEAAYRQAVATVQQDKASLESARINLDYTRVTAPISGRIGASAFTQGALVTASQTSALTTIQRLDPIYVDINQSASELLKLRRDLAAGQLNRGGAASMVVRLKLEDGSDYPLDGKLQFTDVTVDQTTGSVTLRAVFPNPNGVLLPGMYVHAVVTEGVDNQGLLAPQQGVTRDQTGQPTAWIVDAQNKAQLRTLRTAQAIGDKWLVSDGLKAGDRLIVEGVQRVQPGASVHAVPANLPASPSSSAGH